MDSNAFDPGWLSNSSSSGLTASDQKLGGTAHSVPSMVQAISPKDLETKQLLRLEQLFSRHFDAKM